MRRAHTVTVAAGLVASVVTRCDRATDVVITGGCTADPMWLGQLINAKPFGMTDTRVQAGWRCDYRNAGTKTSISVTAEVYCARPAK